MKAIQYLGANKIEVRDIEMPKVPEGFALVKVSHAGICGTDLNIYAGTHPRAKAPLVMGHEFSGVLENDTKYMKKGTRVTGISAHFLRRVRTLPFRKRTMCATP